MSSVTIKDLLRNGAYMRVAWSDAALDREELNEEFRQRMASVNQHPVNDYSATKRFDRVMFQRAADCLPRVAVVILNLNGKTHTQQLLRSLSRAHRGTFNLEVIVVDNGSTDGSLPAIRQELKNFRRSHLIVNRVNRGAAEGKNQALKYALESARSRRA